MYTKPATLFSVLSKFERDRTTHLELLPRFLRADQLLHFPRCPREATRMEANVQGRERCYLFMV